jgi:Ca-activated chloride channel family protein
MRSIFCEKTIVSAVGLFALLAIPELRSQSPEKIATKKGDTSAESAGQVHIPTRSPVTLFKGQQGKQRTEIHFDPATDTVTVKLLVQDQNGYFIPNIRRENFVVYKNGVPQKYTTVEIEHAAVLLGLLREHGGRYQGLNKLVSEEVSRDAHQLLEALGREDKVAIWQYSNNAQQLASFSDGREKLEKIAYDLEPPDVSESNLYDALTVLKQMRLTQGRKAIVLLSSGIDTFSTITLDDTLKILRESSVPVYAIGLGAALRGVASVYGKTGPVVRIDWNKGDNNLQEIARASGGRHYAPESTLGLTAIYDDILENLRMRYVITYKMSSAVDLNSPRTIRVELVNPKTGKPLQIVDANGKVITPNVIVEGRYVPSQVAGK